MIVNDSNSNHSIGISTNTNNAAIATNINATNINATTNRNQGNQYHGQQRLLYEYSNSVNCTGDYQDKRFGLTGNIYHYYYYIYYCH